MNENEALSGKQPTLQTKMRISQYKPSSMQLEQLQSIIENSPHQSTIHPKAKE